MTQTIEQLQAKIAELTSNVSKWASLAEANQQVAESAQRRADKLAAENAMLKTESRDACLGLNDYYGRKLAAAQEECEFQRNAHKQAEELMLEQSKQLAELEAENARIREKLLPYPKLAHNTGFFHLQEFFEEILSIPASTKALDKYVAEKTEEAYLNAQRAHTQFEAELTRQRDLAAEALEWAADVLPPSDPGGIGGCDCPVCRALETIKESDVK